MRKIPIVTAVRPSVASNGANQPKDFWDPAIVGFYFIRSTLRDETEIYHKLRTQCPINAFRGQVESPPEWVPLGDKRLQENVWLRIGGDVCSLKPAQSLS